MKPKISIIIPVYNQAKAIRHCLKSIYVQTFKNFEVIVVNDGSKDKLRLALRPWQTRLKIINQANQGAAVARNRGFSESRGEFLLFCDADVTLNPDMLEKMLNALERDRTAGFVYSSFRFGWKKFKLWPFSPEKLKTMPCIHTTSLIRREAFPGFDESLKKFQDWDLFLTIIEKGFEGIWLDEFLFSVKAGGTMSNWLPKFCYQLPWLKSVKKYKSAEKIIKAKHAL